MKEALVALLYDEFDDAGLDAGGRARLEAHLSSCPACRGELSALRALRLELPAWTPPERELGFAIVDRTARGRPARGSIWALPAWGLAAAAALTLAAGAAIANLDVSYGSDGFRVRTGWPRNENVPVRVVELARPANENPAAWRAEMTSLERRLRQEFSTSSMRAGAVTAPPDASEVLRRVKALIGESESRQQRELALRLAQVLRDVDRQRQTDLVRIQNGLGQLERSTAVDRQLFNQYVRVSQQR